MDIENVYKVNGYINENGLYEGKKDCDTYILECKIFDTEGYSYFAYNKSLNSKATRIIDILSIINNPKINVKKMTCEEVDKEISNEDMEKLKSESLIIMNNSIGFSADKSRQQQFERYRYYFQKLQDIKLSSKNNKGTMTK